MNRSIQEEWNVLKAGILDEQIEEGSAIDLIRAKLFIRMVEQGTDHRDLAILVDTFCILYSQKREIPIVKYLPEKIRKYKQLRDMGQLLKQHEPQLQHIIQYLMNIERERDISILQQNLIQNAVYKNRKMNCKFFIFFKLFSPQLNTLNE